VLPVKILGFPSEGLMLTYHFKYGQQLWCKSKMTSRHSKNKCLICGDMVGNKAYRPITNKSNRMKRICLKHSKDKNAPTI